MAKPHIIILNPDEMRADALGCMGNPAAYTPHLDAFASTEAVAFANAFCQNPVCVPSRCSFFTGLYPHVRGHRTMQHLLQPHETSLFEELKNAGYYVWMNARNDLVAGQIPGLVQRHASEIHYYDKEQPAPRFDPSALQGAHETDYPYSHFAGVSERIANNDMADTLAAVERILHPVEPEKPLCLFLGWNDPHPPYGVQPHWRNKIQTEKLPPRIPYCETSGKSLMIERLHELCGMNDYPESRWQELRAVYLAQCARVDEMFHMVCSALKQAGIYNESAIFVLSDHGDFCGDYDLPEKAQNSFEHCLTRVPLLIKPPKDQPVDPGVSQSLVELVDFYATAMDYAGVPILRQQFGRSLRPVLQNRGQANRPCVFCEGGRNPGETQCDEWHASGPQGPVATDPYWPKKTAQKDDLAHEKGTMVFDGRYKYIHRSSGRHELYDLHSDPGERINSIQNASEALLARLRLALTDWYQQTCDLVPSGMDSRFTEEGLWAIVRGICPAEKEAEMRAALRTGLLMGQAVSYAWKLRAAQQADNKKNEEEPQ